MNDFKLKLRIIIKKFTSSVVTETSAAATPTMKAMMRNFIFKMFSELICFQRKLNCDIKLENLSFLYQLVSQTVPNL